MFCNFTVLITQTPGLFMPIWPNAARLHHKHAMTYFYLASRRLCIHDGIVHRFQEMEKKQKVAPHVRGHHQSKHTCCARSYLTKRASVSPISGCKGGCLRLCHTFFNLLLQGMERSSQFYEHGDQMAATQLNVEPHKRGRNYKGQDCRG